MMVPGQLRTLYCSFENSKPTTVSIVTLFLIPVLLLFLLVVTAVANSGGNLGTRLKGKNRYRYGISNAAPAAPDPHGFS
jgi:hypothetical protein